MALKDGEITALLRAWRGGDAAASDQLFEALHGDLSLIASRLLRRERADISLHTGDLVNEAIVKLLHAADLDVVDQAHLLALSARVMRHVLLDRARRKNRGKRKGTEIVLTESKGELDSFDYDLIALDHALKRLRVIDPKRADIVEMRYFGGMTIEEIALVLGLSRATVNRAWAAARQWLREAIENDL